MLTLGFVKDTHGYVKKAEAVKTRPFLLSRLKHEYIVQSQNCFLQIEQRINNNLRWYY